MIVDLYKIKVVVRSIFFCIYLLMFTSLITATETTSNKACLVASPIDWNEVDEDLQSVEGSSLMKVLTVFQEKGGTIIRLDGNAAPYQLLPGDMVFPSCSAGINRSQTLWNVLRPYSDKITLRQPHATRYGLDPFNGKVNWHRVEGKASSDDYYLWAGVERSPRFGFDVFNAWLEKKEATPEELQIISSYYDREYYNPDIPAGTRRVYITFSKNAHAHLYRLNQANRSLENVVVLYFPLADMIKHPLPEWNTYQASLKSYVEFSNILKAYLDFDRL